MPEKFEGLIEQLERSDGPNRDLDREIWWSISERAREEYRTSNQGVIPPAYTGSVDCILRLVETELPGWGWRLGTCGVSDDAWVSPDVNHPVLGGALAEKFSHLEDPIAWFLEKTDVDLRPPGRQAIAMCMSFLLALRCLDGET